MADVKDARGGFRPGAGRKPKDVEIDLDALMSEAVPRDQRVDIIRVVAAKANSGDIGAARLIMEYAYGKPNQRVDVSSNGETLPVTGYVVIRPDGVKDGD